MVQLNEDEEGDWGVDKGRSASTGRMIEAAAVGKIESVRSALRQGAQVRSDFSLAFRKAAENGYADVVEVLLDAGADIHAMQDAALRSAVKLGRLRVVKALLERGADPDALDGECLIHAATEGKEALVQMLLEHGANPHFFRDHALRRAAYQGNIDIVRALIAHGANVFAMQGAPKNMAEIGGHPYLADYLQGVMDEKRAAFLEAMAQAPVLADFFRQPYQDGDTGLMRGAKMGLTKECLAELQRAGERLSVRDVVETRDKENVRLIDIVAENNGIKHLFAYPLWKGRAEEMIEAWNNLSPILKKTDNLREMNFEKVVAEHRQRSLKENTVKFRPK